VKIPPCDHNDRKLYITIYYYDTVIYWNQAIIQHRIIGTYGYGRIYGHIKAPYCTCGIYAIRISGISAVAVLYYAEH